MLEGLSGLLREVLRPDAGHEAPLADEVAFARRYLDVERARFPDRLRVRVDVEAGLGDALVPRLVLQPLVENALRHGIGRRLGAGRLEIGARRAGAGAVELWVADDGAGLPSDWDDDDGFGVGLANTAARLAELYGPAAALSVHPAPGGGAVARVRLPLSRAPHAPGARSAAADT